LIQSHELDISKISISQITDQYLAYVLLMQELNFDVASEFLVMAATLVLWKSKALLPQENILNAQAGVEDEGGLTQEELIRRLLEHQRFQKAGHELGQTSWLGIDVFDRPGAKVPKEKIWAEMNITRLALAYQDMLVRARRRTQVLRKETVSLAERIVQFGEKLSIGQVTALAQLVGEQPSRAEWVVSFLASLELSRLKKMKVYQEKTYDPIYVELLESLEGFNSQLATGFDSVVEAVESGAAEGRAPAQPARAHDPAGIAGNTDVPADIAELATGAGTPGLTDGSLGTDGPAAERGAGT
jgi:segregation and condensation protein A